MFMPCVVRRIPLFLPVLSTTYVIVSLNGKHKFTETLQTAVPRKRQRGAWTDAITTRAVSTRQLWDVGDSLYDKNAVHP